MPEPPLPAALVVARLRAFYQRPDVIGFVMGSFGTVTTFFPPETWYVTLCLVISFLSFMAALWRATHEQQDEAARQQDEVARKTADAVSAAVLPVRTELAEVRAVIAKRERDVLREGSLKQRALLLGAQMYQFIVTREYNAPMRSVTHEMPNGGVVGAMVPDEEWTTETRRLFREQFSAQIETMMRELRESGVRDNLLSAAAKLYRDDSRQMLMLGWWLQEVAGRLPDHPNYPR